MEPIQMHNTLEECSFKKTLELALHIFVFKSFTEHYNKISFNTKIAQKIYV